MAKCPSCLKFCSYDTSNEPEADLTFDEGTISGTVRIALTSECCGDEVRETSFDIDFQVEPNEVIDKLEAKAKAEGITLPEGYKDWDFESTDDGTVSHLSWDDSVDFGGQVTDRRETTKLVKGKLVPINPRYQKTFYGFEGIASVYVTATWNEGDTPKVLKVQVDVTLEDECQASALEDLT